MMKEYIKPKVTLYSVTETSILSSSNVDWGMATPPTDGYWGTEEDEEFEMG